MAGTLRPYRAAADAQLNLSEIRDLTSRKYDVATRDAVVKGCEKFGHLCLFNVHLNASARASGYFVSIENAAGIRSRVLFGQHSSTITTRPPWRM